MVLTATKDEIGTYLSTLIKKTFSSKRKFCIEYLKTIKMPTNDEEIQKMENRFTQILRGEKNIQTYDLIPVSQILGVSIESILTAGRTRTISHSHITNYSMSFSKDKKEWKRYIDRPDKLILNFDEYGKNIIDYIYEAGNYPFLKYLIENEYMSFVDRSQWNDGHAFVGSTIIKRREHFNTDPLETELQFNDGLRRKAIILAMKYHDQDILTEYRARELPFMYQLNSISIPKDFDFYKDMENDFIEAIASSSPKTLSFFLEEFETKDYWGHTEKYLYPYLAEVAETMIKIRSKEITPVLNSMLNHNRQTYERLNQTIIKAVSQYLDFTTGDGKYPIPEQMKLEYKNKLLNDIRFDKSKHIVSLSILLNNRMGFITNIFNISLKSKDPEISNVIAQINEYYDSITSINDSK